MKLIKKIGVKSCSTGKKESFGLFLCPYCLQEVEKQLGHGKRQKSCGCNRNILISKTLKGNTAWNKGLFNIYSKETLEKMSKSHKGLFLKENHPNWQGGKSKEKYGFEWTEQLKQFIKNRDLNICQTPDCFNDKRLCIHHIDYDKKNFDDNNLITLCSSCHSKTNGKKKREYYQNYYNEIMNIYL